MPLRVFITFHRTGNVSVFIASMCSATTGADVIVLLKRFSLFEKVPRDSEPILFPNQVESGVTTTLYLIPTGCGTDAVRIRYGLHTHCNLQPLRFVCGMSSEMSHSDSSVVQGIITMYIESRWSAKATTIFLSFY